VRQELFVVSAFWAVGWRTFTNCGLLINLCTQAVDTIGFKILGMKKNLVIINQAQFGYHLDTYFYCKYLRDQISVKYICWDHTLPKVKMKNVEIIYVNRDSCTIKRSVMFIKTVVKEINDYKTLYDLIIFIKYFKIVSLLLRLIKPDNLYIFDIRTSSVSRIKIIRMIYNSLMIFESYFFQHITIISNGLAKKLSLQRKAHILPLGAEVISTQSKILSFELNLIYVGTLYNRNIEDTLAGFKEFYNKYKTKINMTYTIIGAGIDNEEEELKAFVRKNHLSSVVRIVGQVKHQELKEYFDASNVGVSYIPITEYFDSQPATKTFEYLMSGMPVIATATTENKAIINKSNGVIINDSPHCFLKGLVEIFNKKENYDSATIRKSVEKYTWENITNALYLYLIDIYRSKIN